MRDDQEHALVPTLKRQLAENAIDRREFLRYATLLGMSASAAYARVLSAKEVADELARG